MQVQVIFSNDSIDLKVVMPNGKEIQFTKVSTMLHWCKENGYEPVVAQ